MLSEIIVYTNKKYTEYESIWLPSNYTKDQIIKEIEKRFQVWFHYDII